VIGKSTPNGMSLLVGTVTLENLIWETIYCGKARSPKRIVNKILRY